MDLYQTILEVIDMRSFSNLWFWIVLAVVWSSVSHWVLGVPYDMVLRARRHGEQTQVDLEDMVRINVNRTLYITQVSGMLILTLASFVLTVLFILAVFYSVEFAQAVLFLAFPLSVVGMLNVSTAQQIYEESATGELLYKRLSRHRLYTQIIGIVSIFVTSIWGMYQNLYVGPFGG
ncbi:component of SufBCD complex [Sulfitobacter sp. CW3]|uniref:component of SufBCD complex n=1 Tax=unclassified Sulfitobacter TaxID=196795 RepID=UPI001C5D6955|nr:component of SufBCD complex [Sulfitobacter sp. CW3]MBW4960960.1 component of SufBCD complex [Sulfitobacter sp. CW3]